MDVKELLKKSSVSLHKYRYAALVLLIGLVLMMIPITESVENEAVHSVSSVDNTEITIEQKLSAVLSQIKGAGEVEVMLTVAKGEETVYQTNEDITTDSDTNSTNFDTVTVTDAQRNQSGLIRQVIPPLYRGAIIVCGGADDPSVRLAIVDAVAKITGLGANQISVLKMK